MSSSSLPGKARKFLFITNVDRGEANVCLAAAYALIQADPDVEIHFATFAGLEDDIEAVWRHACLTVPGAKPITFHKLNGLPMSDALPECIQRNGVPRDYVLNASPGFRSTPRIIRAITAVFVPYTGPQMVDIVTAIIQIIGEVNADAVVVNSLMSAGITACWHLGIRFTCLSPNSIKEFTAHLQPRAQGVWKFPTLYSGFRYPVPWYLIPANIYYLIVLIIAFRSDKNTIEVATHLQSQMGITLRTAIDFLRGIPPNLKVIVGTLPELDFPLSVIPPHIFPCGPMIRAAPPISESDPELAGWLAQGPTILLNLGSLCKINEDRAIEMALALRTVLDKASEQSWGASLQVLWKLSKIGEYKVVEPGATIYHILEEELKTDRVRIVNWVQAQPISILQSGHIVCSIHHGGANSYNEAIIAGVPHVVLPQWTDCYDYANRVEMLGIGRWGSKQAKPRWTARELSREILDVLVGRKSESMKQKAQKLAEVCQQNGDGAANAAQILIAECDEKRYLN
ncbi:Glycosyltransferase sdnJ [Cladobotryum mycophilum]|uniref:Glycosyltransferase sdnJ n=1 Tax=Cladobotryum mycophilum TaxID=491253 RepID=A0ABR0T472_9HYPO